jgi:hypothetical protein
MLLLSVSISQIFIKLSKTGSGWKNEYGTLTQIINEKTQQL